MRQASDSFIDCESIFVELIWYKCLVYEYAIQYVYIYIYHLYAILDMLYI